LVDAQYDYDFAEELLLSKGTIKPGSGNTSPSPATSPIHTTPASSVATPGQAARAKLRQSEKQRSIAQYNGVKPLCSEEVGTHSCDSCKSAITVGSRYHCTVCFDFDLCDSCYKKGDLVVSHNPTHLMHVYNEPNSTPVKIVAYTWDPDVVTTAELSKVDVEPLPIGFTGPSATTNSEAEKKVSSLISVRRE
jgi:hypothetical protein